MHAHDSQHSSFSCVRAIFLGPPPSMPRNRNCEGETMAVSTGLESMFLPEQQEWV